MHDDGHRCVAGEHRLPCQHEIGYATSRVDVCSTINLRPHRLLGRDVRRRSLHDVVARDTNRNRTGLHQLGCGLGNTEVQHLHEVMFAAVPAHEQVGRLDVAVNEPIRFGLRQRVAHLAQQIDHALGGSGAITLHQPLEVEAIEQLHHVIEAAIVGHTEVEELDGVR